MRFHLASTLAAALLLSACATDDTPAAAEPSAQAPVATKPVAPAADPAAPADGTATAASAQAAAPSGAVAGYPVTVSNVAPSGTLGDGQKVVVSATPGENQISVRIENLVTYCAPAPVFGGHVAGDTLQLTLLPAKNPSKCARPQSLDAVIPVPSRSNVRQVVLVTDEGNELARATIAAAAVRCYVKGPKGECFDSAEEACAAMGCAADQCICTEATSNNSCSCN